MTKIHPKPNPLGGFGFLVSGSHQIGTENVFGFVDSWGAVPIS